MANQVIVKDHRKHSQTLGKLLWNPDESGLLGKDNTLTKEYIMALCKCFSKLKSDPNNFSLYNPENGWAVMISSLSSLQAWSRLQVELLNMDTIVSRFHSE